MILLFLFAVAISATLQPNPDNALNNTLPNNYAHVQPDFHCRNGYVIASAANKSRRRRSSDRHYHNPTRGCSTSGMYASGTRNYKGNVPWSQANMVAEQYDAANISWTSSTDEGSRRRGFTRRRRPKLNANRSHAPPAPANDDIPEADEHHDGRRSRSWS